MPITSPNANNTPEPKPRHAGPHPGIVALVFVTLFLANLIIWPFRSERAQVQRIMAFLQFGPAVPWGC